MRGGAGNPTRLGQVSQPGWIPRARPAGARIPVAAARRRPRARAGVAGRRWRGARPPGRGVGVARGGSSPRRRKRPPSRAGSPPLARPSPCKALPPRALQGTSSRPEAHTRRFLPGAPGRRPAGGCGREPGPPGPPAPGSQRPGDPLPKRGRPAGLRTRALAPSRPGLAEVNMGHTGLGVPRWHGALLPRRPEVPAVPTGS